MLNEETSEGYLVDLSSTVTGWDKPREKLRKAFSQNEFILYSQPIIKLGPGERGREHFEVFIRMKEEEDLMIPPGSFLPMLEYFSLGPTLDRYVLRKLLESYRSIKPGQRGIAHVGLCNDTLASPEFCAFVQEELKRTKTAGELLCFQFPGNEVNDPTSTAALADGLKKIGCQLSVGAMDDKEISFDAIKQFGARFLKISGRLMQGLEQSESIAAEVGAVASKCRWLGVQTIAQNVDNALTLDLLRKLDISFAQGHGIASPAPLAE